MYIETKKNLRLGKLQIPKHTLGRVVCVTNSVWSTYVTDNPDALYYYLVDLKDYGRQLLSTEACSEVRSRS